MSVNQTLLSRIKKMINMPLFSPLTGQPKSMAIITPAIPSQWSFYGYIIAGVIKSLKRKKGSSVMDPAVLNHTRLFRGMTEDEVNSALLSLRAQEKRYAPPPL